MKVNALRTEGERWGRGAGTPFLRASWVRGADVVAGGLWGELLRVRLVWVLAIWVGWGTWGVGGVEPVRGGYREDRILVIPGAGRGEGEARMFHGRMKARVRTHFGGGKVVQVVEVPQGRKSRELLEEYRNSGLFDWVEPDYWLTPLAVVSDPYFVNGAQWHLRNQGQLGGKVGADIGAETGWETLNSASNIVVALVDTGTLVTHEDLAGNLWVNPGEIAGNGVDDDGNGFVDDVHGINAFANNGDLTDLTGHGTMVAGLIGAVGNNGVGVSGVAWRVRVMPCRYVDNAGAGSVSDAVQCFDYARTMGARVINASFASTNYSASLHTAINQCRTAGIVVVAGAGNGATDNDVLPYYPASETLDNVLCVGATDRFDLRASYSCYGATSVDLMVPGTDVMSTAGSGVNHYASSSGTSFSCAIMSGAMALIRARYPQDTPAALIQRVLGTVDVLPSLAGKCVSGGRLNLARALGPSLEASFLASVKGGAAPVSVGFTDTSFGDIGEWNWDFGDGGVSLERSPTHSYGAAGIYTVTLTVRGERGGLSVHQERVHVEEPYRVESGEYGWLVPAEARVLALGQNGVSTGLPLPFPFRYFGAESATLYVGMNGLAGFVSSGLSSSQNENIPLGADPQAMMCVYWDALSPVGGGTITVGTVGEAPSRRYVVTWSGVYTTGVRITPVTFQLMLLEGSNEVWFQYQEVGASSRSGSASGKTATIGLEGFSGQVGHLFSYNGSTLVTNGMALRYVPSAASMRGLLSVSSNASPEMSGYVGGPFNPSALRYTLTHSGNGTAAWKATRTQPWLKISPDSGTLAAGESVEVSVGPGLEGAKLSPGEYEDFVVFTQTDGGGVAEVRKVKLWVRERSIPVLSIRSVEGLGKWDIQIQGDPGTAYVLEETSDFRLWKAVVVLAADGDGRVSHVQEWDTSQPSRFFRVTLSTGVEVPVVAE